MLKYNDYLKKTLDEVEIILPQFKMALLSNLFYRHAYYLTTAKKNVKIVLREAGHIPVIIMEEKK